MKQLERLAASRVERLNAATLIALQDDTWTGREGPLTRRSIALDLAFQNTWKFAMTRARSICWSRGIQICNTRLAVLFKCIATWSKRRPRLAGHGPRPGERFADLPLMAELGRGGLSRVFLATQPEMGGRLVVVKVSPSGGDEAAIHGPLSHPNIVAIYSRVAEPDRDLSGLCMPFEGAATLGDLLDLFAVHGPVSSETILAAANLMHLEDADASSDSCRWLAQSAMADEEPAASPLEGQERTDHVDRRLLSRSYAEGVAHLVAQLADALAYTHARGVIHNDIKPSNVLLTPAGRPKLLDFNLSADVRLRELRAGGTLPYMAPERIDELFHDGPRPDAPEQADLYSLGVVLYQLLCGANPLESAFAADASPREAAAAIRRRQQTLPRFLEPAWRQTPLALQRVVASCLAEDPVDRPRSASDLRRQLELALLPRPQEPWGKPRLWAAGVLGGLLMVCGMGGGEASPTLNSPRSSEFQNAKKACHAKQYASAAEGFRLAYQTEGDLECLAWRLYCLLCDAKEPHEAGKLFDELKRANYSGRELQLNYAAYCSFLSPVSKEFVERGIGFCGRQSSHHADRASRSRLLVCATQSQYAGHCGLWLRRY